MPQNSAFFGVRGKEITSPMFPMPVTNSTKRSSPMPKPACGTVPNSRVAKDSQSFSVSTFISSELAVFLLLQAGI